MIGRTPLRIAFGGVTLLPLLLLGPIALAAGPKKEPVPAEGSAKKASPPIRIKGSKANFTDKDKKESELLLTGDVEVRQGETTVTADKLTAILDKLTKEIRTAIATGDVRVRSGKKVGTAKKAEFDKGGGIIILTGQPRLWEDGNVVEGQKIVFHVEGGEVDCNDCVLVLERSGVPGGVPR